MGKHDRVNGDPNNKGENWPKFLSEMQALGPVIQSRLGDVTPVNRGQARGQGRKNLDDFLRKETLRLADQQRFRDFKVNEWFDVHMRKVAPRLFRLVERIGPRWAFLIRFAGYKLAAHDGMEGPLPYTICTISRFGFLCNMRNEKGERVPVALRMFWEDPKKAGIPHKRERGDKA